jgi:hypothetical protein
MSELLRIEQRGCEVNQQQDRKQESYYSDEVHGLPQLLTGLDVEKGRDKENGSEKEHGQILHAMTLISERHAATRKRAIPKSILWLCALCSRKGNLKEI